MARNKLQAILEGSSDVREPRDDLQIGRDNVAPDQVMEISRGGNEGGVTSEDSIGLPNVVTTSVDELATALTRRRFFEVIAGTSVSGLVAACSAASLSSHSNSNGTRVVYEPGFMCYPIVSDFGSLVGVDGRLRRSTPHTGLDILGEIIIAPADGEVRIINFRSAYGYQASLKHSPQDLGIPDTYAITWYSHLREKNGDNSALAYVRMGQRVVRGQPMGEIGRTGTMSGGVDHLHWQVYVKKGSYPNDNFGPDLVNPHDFWDRDEIHGNPSILQFEKGRKYSGGFTFPVKCPDKKKP